MTGFHHCQNNVTDWGIIVFAGSVVPQWWQCYKSSIHECVPSQLGTLPEMVLSHKALIVPSMRDASFKELSDAVMWADQS